jgi:ABC-type transport system substrate-binding protein
MSKFKNGRTFDEVQEASIEMQRILHYNVPQLVICQSNFLQGYRIDKFLGHIEDVYRYLSGPWTLRRIRQIDYTHGGTVSIAIGYEPDTFNFYTATSPSSRMIFENTCPSLYSRGPDMIPIPDLAEAMLVEINSDNPTVPQGHTRFTFDILQNATWSDSTQLTAEDIAFTFVYQLESSVYGNPASDSLNDLVSVYAPSSDKVVFEFSSENYWNFHKIAYEYIIPKHIFVDIGYEGWNTWNPMFNPVDPYVTCGPFLFTDMEAGEFYELTINPDYHWLPPHSDWGPPYFNSIPASTPTPVPQFRIIPLTISTTSSVIIVGVILLLIREKKRVD